MSVGTELVWLAGGNGSHCLHQSRKHDLYVELTQLLVTQYQPSTINLRGSLNGNPAKSSATARAIGVRQFWALKSASISSVSDGSLWYVDSFALSTGSRTSHGSRLTDCATGAVNVPVVSSRVGGPVRSILL